MIVFVDYEHPDGFTAEYSQRMQAARTWITYRLEDLADMHCMLVRYDRLSWELLDRLQAKAIFISGNSIDPDRYDPDATRTLTHVIADSGLPIFGFCGGWQIMATALGANVIPLDFSAEMVDGDDRLVTLPGGRPFEYGYHQIELSASHAVFEGIEPEPVVRHAHGLHVPAGNPPSGFETLAANTLTPVQMAADDNRRMIGTQFHPEYWTDEHPAGRMVISNFLTWAGVTAPDPGST